MSRDIEHLVETHRLAFERRRQGLPIWDRTINIKDIIHRDKTNETPEHAAAVANEIAALIRAHVPPTWLDDRSDDFDEELFEIVDGMETLTPNSYADDPSYSVLEDLNNMLTGLYDWADIKRVWLGL